MKDYSEVDHYLHYLKDLCKNTVELHKCLKKCKAGDGELPSWVQDKIILAHHNIEASLRYFDIKKGKHYHSSSMDMNEADTKNAYQNFLKTKLKSEFGTTDLGKLSSKEKKEFFNQIEREWDEDEK